MESKNLKIKLVFNSEIRVYNGEFSFDCLCQYITKAYQITEFKLTYLDEDNDEITVSCIEDLEPLKDFKIKLQITETSSTSSSSEQQQKPKKPKRSKEEIMKMIEEKKKEHQQKMKEKRQNFYEKIKKDEFLSFKMTKFQKKAKHFITILQEFTEQDFESSCKDFKKEDLPKEQKKAKKMELFKELSETFPMIFRRGFRMMHKFHDRKNTPHPFFNKGCRQQQQDSATDEQSQKPIHRRVVCDGCQKFPIIGTRYKCKECADFDFCEECKNSQQKPHEHAQFEAIEKPVQYNWRQHLKSQQQQQQGEGENNCEKRPGYGPRVQMLASQVAEILGGNKEDYLKVCKENKKEGLQGIINVLLKDEQEETLQ